MRAAAQVTHNGRVGLIATQGTVDSGVYEDALGVVPGASFTFPHPLPVGATHTFSTSLRFPSRKCLLPEFAFRPHSTTLNARIDIYFGNRLPSLIEVFETTGSPGQVPSPHVTEALIPRHPIQHFEFPEIQRGLGVGVRWLFNDQHRARIPAGVTL